MFWRIIWQNPKSTFKNAIFLLGIYSTEILVYVSKKKFLKAVHYNTDYKREKNPIDSIHAYQQNNGQVNYTMKY